MGKMDETMRLLAAGAVLLCGFAAAATYHLDESGAWQNVADTPEGEYLLAVSKIKQQIHSGREGEAITALEALQEDFPELAGEQIDMYIAAEKLYAEGEWGKAAAQYKRFLNAYPDSGLYPAAMERLYSIGVAFLQGQKRTFVKILKLPAFDEGVELMWDIADRAGHSPIARRALTTLAENQEQQKKYFEAYETWSEIKSRWPTGKTGRQAVRRMAEELHASYDGPQYDAGALLSARSYYEDFIARYPEVAQEYNIAEQLELVQEQLAYKEYNTGFYYERTGKSDAAKKYYERVLAEWPDSKAAAMAQARLKTDSPPAVKQTSRRKLFDIASGFLDSWFGIEKLHDKMMESQNQESVQ